MGGKIGHITLGQARRSTAPDEILFPTADPHEVATITLDLVARGTYEIKVGGPLSPRCVIPADLTDIAKSILGKKKMFSLPGEKGGAMDIFYSDCGRCKIGTRIGDYYGEKVIVSIKSSGQLGEDLALFFLHLSLSKLTLRVQQYVSQQKR